MAEVGVRYTVTVQKQGTGGAEAAAELQTLQRTAAQTNASLNANNAQLASLATTGKATQTALRGLGGVLTIAGLQQFPQLTSAAMVTKSSLDAVRMSGASLTAGFGVMTAGIAGLAAALISAKFAWDAYRASQIEAMTARALRAQTSGFSERLRDEVRALQEAGRITIEQREQLMRTLFSSSAEGNETVRDFLKGLDRGSATQRMSDLQQKFAQIDASREANLRPGQQIDRLQQRLDIAERYNEELKLTNQLLQEGLVTEQQATSLRIESDIRQQQASARLNAQLTETKKLAQDIATNFASGLASALVNTFREGASALRDFASQFLAQTAQMIAQLLIIRALRSAFPALGLAGGGVIFAANGLAGVGEVSSPTYFPKFNVVAGEAGREMMTVLARPRFMEIGGMQAVVGNAGPSKLAITDANELAARGGAGAGGGIVIEIRHTPEVEARIIENSVSGALVRVTTEMGRDSKLSRATKQL